MMTRLQIALIGCSMLACAQPTPVVEPASGGSSQPAPEGTEPAPDFVDIRWMPADENCNVPEPESRAPSRFNDWFTFASDGTFTTAVLAANDAHYAATGTWYLDDDVVHVEFEVRTGEQSHAWTITEASSERFCLEGRGAAME